MDRQQGSSVAVIGGGPAGLIAAELLSAQGRRVTVYERMPTFGRKLLIAGRGGLNLTHSEPLERFKTRYGEAADRIAPCLDAFPPAALIAWAEDLGQPTFVGSSGRVFPQGFKASPLLRAWLRRLDAMGVQLKLRHRWTGWDSDGRLTFQTSDGHVAVAASATVLALGGASWPRLGSDGSWVETLEQRGIDVAPLRPANCGFTVAWSDVFKDRFAGHPLKTIELTFGSHTIRGEAVLTRDGIEGGAIYALSAALRDAIAAAGQAMLRVALRPDLDANNLTARLSAARGKQSFSTFLRKAAGLSPVVIGVLQEVAMVSGVSLSAMRPEALAARINNVEIVLTGTSALEKSISTAGGIAFDELDANYMLRQLPGIFVAGEMLDWEAPTGGYLLQASFATGAAAGRGALKLLGK